MNEEHSPTPRKDSPIYLFIVISILSFVVALFIGARIVGNVEHNPRPVPRQTNVNLIQTWMTLPYLSHVYGVPMSEFRIALQIDKKSENQSITKLAKQLGMTPQALTTQIQMIITSFQSTHQEPPTPKP